MIQRKALVLLPKLYPMPCASFKASKGWLRMIISKHLVKPSSRNFPPRAMTQGTKGETMAGELIAKTYANDFWCK